MPALVTGGLGGKFLLVPGALVTGGLGGKFLAAPGATLQQALENVWAARTDLHTLVSDGNLWHDEAIEGTDLPYVEFFKVSQPDDAITTAFKVQRATVQFNCYHWTDAQAMAVRDALMSGFSRAVLTIGSTPVLHCIPGDPMEDKAEGKGPKGRDCYCAMFTLDILLTSNF